MKRGFDLEITNGNSSALIRPLYPRQLAYSDFVHDYPDDLYWEVHEAPAENMQDTVADGRLMHLNSWIEADGWSTDAYMLAVSYPEGTNPADAKEFFIGHGSALRRNGDVYFSSLSKLNLIADDNDGKLDIQVTGQPRINLKFKSSPSSLTVNGINTPVKKTGNLVNIKLYNKK